ncbi:MAG: SusD/RagB family nutrient-binding outer membrane lipoprotein [Bacteroidetes bacterium]|nr:SusD/RagB family nutrient-binding outer membrane lipoprotein [Bacteroidota bacterium]MBS1539593.1 SusD/RagB family nutrient-binding outer membrane lipoprotein [Bacteroidota bacterium]
MKTNIKILFAIMIGGLLTACNSYLDINTNPNSAVSSTPKLLISSALVGSARVLEGYNAYGAETGGYAANAGGYGGFNEFVTYQYTNNTGQNLWSNTYQNLENYQQIINLSQGNSLLIYYQAIAEIMMAHNFQLLVDEYNDVPYTKALAGIGNLTPTYDGAASVYVQLASLLDDAIAKINQGMAAVPAPTALAAEDVVYGGNMANWLKFANTLKLKLMVRGNGKATFTNTSFDPSGFLTTDVLVNPGFKNDNGRQNPKWGSWAWDYAGNAINKAWMPTTFVLSFYDGNKIADPARGTVVYYLYSTGTAKITNQLGYESTTVPSCPEGTFWYSGTNRTPSSAGSSPGVLKGPDAGYPLFTAAESYFLQAEAALVGITIPGSPTDAASFANGITASFNYLYSLPNGTQAVGLNYAADAAAYITANAGNYLADYSSASTTAQKLEAIITQKYIALNFIHSHEGWNEYRRTTYPHVATVGPTARTSFASIKSQSTRPDKLPTRLLYPVTEARYNPENVPQNISPWTSLIFWAQ